MNLGISVGDRGELSGHKRLGGEEDGDLYLKNSRFKLMDNMGNGDLGTASCICKHMVLWESMGYLMNHNL